jgi:hypothetical protein
MNGGARALGSSYVVIQRIGRGATGEVWRGTDHRTGDDVAIKILRTEFAEDPNIVERFLRERALLSRLDDPHVVRLRDLVVEGDTVALVTDLVPGGDLRARLDRDGPMPPGQAIDLTAQVLEGLASAHRHGIVHRDLKPENVLLVDHDDELVARVTDFGISTLAYSAPSHATSLIGSPEYMAPEVVEQHTVTGAADVYSAGILLYELLSGHTPFAGGSPIAVLRGQVDDPPPRLAGLPGDVWNELASLLAKDPSARPRNAQVAAKRLRALADDVDGLSILPDDLAEGDHVIDIRDADEQATFVPGDRAGSGAARVYPVEAAELHRLGPSARPVDETGRRWWPWAVAAAILVVAGAGAAAWLASSGGSARTHITYTSAPVLQGGDIVVTRDWILSGGGGENVTVRLHLRNLGTRTLATFPEHPLVPLLGTTLYRTFRVDLRPGASTTITYRSHVDGPLDANRVTQQLRMYVEVGAPPRLAAVVVGTPSLRLREHERAYLNVSGAVDGVTNGDLRTRWVGDLLAGIVWHSSARDVVDVQQAGADGRPVLTAGRTGVADVTARVGDQTLVSHVMVSASSAPVVSGPCEPGTTDSIDNARFLDGAHVAMRGDPARQYVIAGGARLPATPPAGAYVQPVDDAVVDAIPTIPHDGTVLETGDVDWIVQAGYRFKIPDTELSPAQRDALVKVPTDAVTGIPEYASQTFAPREGTLVRSAAGGPELVYLGNTWHTTTAACSRAAVVTVPRSGRLPSAQ